MRSLDPDVEGVELFLDRAVAADAGFTPGDDRSVLVELCRHLDGIPLAIELAAARVRAMSPAEVLARLNDRFRLLRGGTRGGLDRHRTLTATLDWSYWGWAVANAGWRGLGDEARAYDTAIAARATGTSLLGPWADAWWSAALSYLSPAGSDEAFDLTRHAEAGATESGNPQLRADVLVSCARTCLRAGDVPGALDRCREGQALAETHDLAWGRARALETLVAIAATGALPQTAELFGHAIASMYASRAWFNLWPSLRSVASRWTVTGQWKPAAVIVGHLEAHLIASIDDTARATLATDPDLAHSLALGARLDRDQLIAYILDQLTDVDRPDDRT